MTLLGQVYDLHKVREVLEGAKFSISILKPFNNSFGSGKLRIVSVRTEKTTPELLLAYEDYLK